jgi:N-methylhydantoinase B/oxoprolinase/acetone carboxylase alpha subunit
MRTRTGWYIHHALFAALAEVLPDRVMAAPGLLGGLTVYAASRNGGKTFHSWFFNGGGMGAGSHTDGITTCIYPSSASNVPVELFEVAVPLLVEEKELLTDSGGAGRHRGGLGQRMSFRLLEGFEGMATVAAQPMGQRVPPFGLEGATAATTADIMINRRVLSREENLALSGALDLTDSNLVVSIDTAGGGGFGPPEERDPVRVREDVRNEIVSLEQAAQTYRVVINPATLTIDEAATSARRRELSARHPATTRDASSRLADHRSSRCPPE